MCETSYQEAVEELVHAQAEHTDDGVAQVEEEEHVHHDRFVASGERPLVPHETHEKDQLVEELKGKKIKEKRSSDGCGGKKRQHWGQIFHHLH